jgi:hypothetical protein
MTVRNAARVCLLLLALGASHTSAQQSSAGEQFLGTWAGTWELPGAGSGGFELTLEKGKEGAVTGKVAVTGDPAYTATIKTLTFDGPKMTALYDFPPDERAEVQLVAAFDGSAANGTWVLREKGGGAEVANGTWTVKKKAAR